MSSIKKQMKKIPILGNLVAQLYWRIINHRKISRPFPGSNKYWEDRYVSGGNSGVGSYDKFGEFKSEILNAFVGKYNVASVIEFGCGDGNQLKLADYPE